MEWTNQHGCGGNSNVNCEIVIQYVGHRCRLPWLSCHAVRCMPRAIVASGTPRVTLDVACHARYMCEDSNPGLRDGTPTDVNDAATDTMNENGNDVSNQRFGYHEPIEWCAIPATSAPGLGSSLPHLRRAWGLTPAASVGRYNKCKRRERNKGLYIADRKLNKVPQIPKITNKQTNNQPRSAVVLRARSSITRLVDRRLRPSPRLLRSFPHLPRTLPTSARDLIHICPGPPHICLGPGPHLPRT
jgi:hypothetical protein